MPPSYLQGFHCNILHNDLNRFSCFSKVLYHISNVVCYDSMSHSLKNFAFNVSTHYEPQLYHQIVRHEDKRTRMRAELNTMS